MRGLKLVLEHNNIYMYIYLYTLCYVDSYIHIVDINIRVHAYTRHKMRE